MQEECNSIAYMLEVCSFYAIELIPLPRKMWLLF